MPKRVKIPEGYESEQDYLAAMRKDLQLDLDADKNNREAGLEDAEFTVGKQWPDNVRQKRERAKKPVLTFNRLIAFVGIVVGNWLLNQVMAKVIPDNGGTKDVARVREGLIRSIQKNSNAKFAYSEALKNQVISGIGNFQVQLDYADDDVFDQDIKIAAIINPFSVVWDRLSVEPTGSDAKHVYVMDELPLDEFKHRWPDASPDDVTVDTSVLGEMRSQGWFDTETVRVVAHWRILKRKRTLALFRDGSVQDITDKALDELHPGPGGEQVPLVSLIVQRSDGEPVIRESDRTYAQMYLCSGNAILDGPYELPIKRVPVFRVPGWEVSVGKERHRFGLVRFLKDPQRLHNYWRSVIAEKLMLSPKAQWIAPDTAVEGRENEWRNAHHSDDNLLVYNGEAGVKPERTPPAQIESALIQESGTTTQDLRDISNMHEASLGIQSNEVSGKAIVARQRVGELGTAVYQVNLVDAIEQSVGVMNDLIPIAYDQPRIVKIVGEDDKALLQAINDTGNPESIDITAGKYSVTAITGPSTATKRIEAEESMMALFNAAPQALAPALDKLIEAMDWPGADGIAKRVKKTLAPELIDPDDMTPEQQMQAQQAAQQAALQAEIQQQAIIAEIENKKADTEERLARAAQARALAAKAEIEAQVLPGKASSEIRSRRLQDTLKAIDVAEPKEKDRGRESKRDT